MSYFSYKEILERRAELFKLINGDVFYSTSQWPSTLRRDFWQKPLNDSDSFKLLLFLIANGLEPKLAAEWVMLSQYWTHDHEKMKKRARQADFVMSNIEVKKSEWFYFDIFHGRLLFLNGDEKQWMKNGQDSKDWSRRTEGNENETELHLILEHLF